MQAYQACPRLHQISYVKGYRPVEKSYALDWGTLLHTALEAWWLSHAAGRPDSALEAARVAIHDADAPDLDKAKARIVMAGYDTSWSAAMVDYEVLAVEAEFRYPARDFDLGGKIDGIIRHKPSNRILLLEHKNTSSDFDVTSDYWRKLRMEPQVSQYFRGARSLGYEINGCLWDVLRRPEQKLYLATPEAARKYTKATAKEPSRLYAGQRENDETLEEFEQRLTDLICSAPADWYARQEIVRLPEELEAFDDDVMAIASDCVRAADPDRHEPRSPGSCHRYGRPCDFLPVCSRYGSLDDESKYRKITHMHEELTNV
jgi:hypothetical protein